MRYILTGTSQEDLNASWDDSWSDLVASLLKGCRLKVSREIDICQLDADKEEEDDQEEILWLFPTSFLGIVCKYSCRSTHRSARSLYIEYSNGAFFNSLVVDGGRDHGFIYQPSFTFWIRKITSIDQIPLSLSPVSVVGMNISYKPDLSGFRENISCTSALYLYLGYIFDTAICGNFYPFLARISCGASWTCSGLVKKM